MSNAGLVQLEFPGFELLEPGSELGSLLSLELEKRLLQGGQGFLVETAATQGDAIQGFDPLADAGLAEAAPDKGPKALWVRQREGSAFLSSAPPFSGHQE